MACTVEASLFERAVATGFRTVNAVWVAPVLLFILLAPQFAGAAAEFLALRASGRQLPLWLIAMVIVGHLSILWLPVVALGVPWVVGGAAAQFRDRLLPPERTQSFVEQANRFYGRTLAILIVCGLAVMALFAVLYVMPLWMMIRDRLFFTSDRPLTLMTAAVSQTEMIYCAVNFLAAFALVFVRGALFVASIVVEDTNFWWAIRTSLSISGRTIRQGFQLWLVAFLIGLSLLFVFQWVARPGIDALLLIATAILTAGYIAWTAMFLLAVAVSLTEPRRSDEFAVSIN